MAAGFARYLGVRRREHPPAFVWPLDETYSLIIYSLVEILDECLADLAGFEWDAGNAAKNWLQHRVRQTEAEQALLNRPLVFAVDLKHSRQEPRFMAMGQTDTKRQLAIVFTVRDRFIRVISARPLSRPERKVYAKAQTRPETDS